jgi:hypothetical protein
MTSTAGQDEVRLHKDHRGVDLISDALPFGRMWSPSRMQSATQSDMPSVAARSHDAVIRVYNEAGNVIETHEPKGDFKE